MEAALIIGWAIACSAVVAWCSARLAGIQEPIHSDPPKEAS